MLEIKPRARTKYIVLCVPIEVFLGTVVSPKVAQLL